MKNRFRTGLIAALCLCAGLLNAQALRTCSGEADERELVGINEADTCAVPDTVYLCDEVEEMPQYPGGWGKMLMDIREELTKIGPVEVGHMYGHVILQCVINKDGSISDIEVLRSWNPFWDKRAVRALRSLPKLIPGRHNGKPVRVRFVVPVSLRLVQ
ncbi:energy transducer TonB [Bacteroides sp. ET225]|uniref:energy transducer TonB n=1 Tax=Bacteroides sp. ET225 TaxID=2972461 RepID=UPI0021AD285B|nr:energy transducer TonB [Bacteroides sp. ET225]MCR8917072.1 energy transducer TonB [Bacteroides sp. ET225]